VHEGGYGLALVGGQAQFTHTNGTAIPDAACGRFRGNVASILGQNDREGLAIDSKTPIPRWNGEAMDRNQAVLGLLQRE
jgi:hypothetical protein